MSSSILFLSTARYSYPLDTTTEKKFAALQSVARAVVIGFGTKPGVRTFQEHATFYLLPNSRIRLLRYACVLLVAPVLGLYLTVRDRLDCVIAQSPYEGLGGVFITRAARLFGHRPRLIVESHGDFEGSLFLYRKVFAAGLMRVIMRTSARFVLRRADALRAVSPVTRAQLAHFAPGRPIEQFPTWTDVDAFRAANRQAGAANSGIILYAGALTPLKGVQHLVAAFAQVSRRYPHARLILAGGAMDVSFEKSLHDAVRRERIEDRVAFIGHVSQRELADWLSRAAVFVLPSYSEGLARVLIEAMVVGVPVISTPVGGAPEMVQPGETGMLVPPGDEAGLASALAHLLGDTAEAMRMGANAKNSVRQFYSTEDYVAGYRALIRTAQLSVS